MLAQWPIRRKIQFGTSLLLAIVAILSITGFHGVYSYRALWRSLRGRAEELPFAAALGRHVSDMRATVAEIRGHYESLSLAEADAAPPAHSGSVSALSGSGADFSELNDLGRAFRDKRRRLHETMLRYRTQIAENDDGDSPIDDSQGEQRTVAEIERHFAEIDRVLADPVWHQKGPAVEAISAELDQVQALTSELPGLLHQRIHELAGQVRTQYRTMIGFATATTVSAAILLTLCIHLFYGWIFAPLERLIQGSRRVAAGDFNHRIHLPHHDEMAELAAAFNAMTGKFQSIRDDLDRQVQERTKQAVRSEQLASVGFLAAGVAHEINNPLASIAMCAESLEARLGALADSQATGPGRGQDGIAAPQQGRGDCADAPQQGRGDCADAPQRGRGDTAAAPPEQAEWEIVRHYLQMIQNEAFRCKGITERLLDFSRVGDMKRVDTELGDLVRNMMDTVKHLGKYHDRSIELVQIEPVVAAVNSQEMKQVVLNLLTNALDSLDPGGRVRVEVCRDGDQAEMLFVDNGCGMTPDVLEHLFEPFFTRRRTGQGIGLGLSITDRIVADHGGRIEAHSDGPEQGSTFRVVLPLAHGAKEVGYRCQAA